MLWGTNDPLESMLAGKYSGYLKGNSECCALVKLKLPNMKPYEYEAYAIFLENKIIILSSIRYFCLKVCVLSNLNSHPPLIILLSVFREVAIHIVQECVSATKVM